MKSLFHSRLCDNNFLEVATISLSALTRPLESAVERQDVFGKSQDLCPERARKGDALYGQSEQQEHSVPFINCVQNLAC